VAALIIVRTLNLLCGALALGIPAVLALAVLPPMLGSERISGERLAMLRRLVFLAWIAIGLGLLSGMLWLLLLGASMSGRGVVGAATGEVLGPVLWRTRFGSVAMIRTALAVIEAICLALVLAARTARMRIVVLAPAAFAAGAGFVALAWAGHAAATPGIVHLAGDAAHLLAAGTWIGGLVVLAVLFGTANRAADSAWLGIMADATRRFSLIGFVCVGTLLATGLINSWFLVGTLPALIGTDYGHLLLIKISLFALMVGLATINRFRLMPRISAAAHRRKAASAGPAIQSLRRNTIAEFVMGALVLGIVSSLGRVPPGLHDQPWWPFPWRPSSAALELPAVHNEIMFALVMMAMGVVICLIGVVHRRHRLLAVPVGLGLIVCFSLSLRLLTVQAYPTSFYHSAVAYTTDSIAHGGRLYVENCAQCHGARGKGEGPNAANLRVQPADLTAAHVLDHTEGDIFWWLTAGIPESDMPGFADHLSEADRWDLVNWVRTMPVGGLDEGLTPEVSDAAPRAPDFTFRTADGTEETLSDRLMDGPLLLVLFTPATSQPRLEQLEAARANLGEAGLSVLALPIGDKGDGSKDPAASFVAAADPSVSAVYQLIATARAEDAPPPPTHLEFLIDRDGYLRALWQPGADARWQDIPTLVHEVHQLAERPLKSVAMPMDMHMQMN
jgi:putative copper export protein/mono/diheme cytochrome c family protein